METIYSPSGKMLLENEALTFSDGILVPLMSPYYNAYNPSNLTPMKRVRDLHKTFELRHSIKSEIVHYINYGLRACIVSMLNDQVSSDYTPALITIYFSTEYALKLAKEGDPISYYADVIRKRFKKFLIDDFFMIFEQGHKSSTDSEISGLHIHIVAFMNESDKKELNGVLRKKKEVLLDIHGGIASSAVKIQFGYYPKIYENKHWNPNKSFVALLADRNPKTKWRRATAEERDKGVLFTTIDELVINVGLADYLSKGLNKPIFANRNTNSYICQALRNKVRSLAMARIGVF